MGDRTGSAQERPAGTCLMIVPNSSPRAQLAGAGIPPWSYRYITVSGVDLHVVDHGPVETSGDLARETPALLLVHGAQGNWSHWRANIEALSRSYRVLVPDMPGFGLSGDLPNAGLAELAQAIAGIADALSIKAFTLVGYSFGSLVATTLAGVRPDLVNRLMIVNPPGWLERSPEMTDLQIKAAIRSKEAGLRAGLEFTLREIMLRHHDAIDEACLDASEFAVRNLRMISKDISRSVDLFSLLRDVSAPWWVVFSAEDPYHRYRLDERRSRLADFRGDACTTVVNHARHWVQQDRPDAFNQLVTRFITSDARPASLPDRV